MVLYKKCYFLFILGGIGYSAIEILWRGYTHPSMGILGGLCLIAIWFINSKFNALSILFRAGICAVVITVMEFLTGILLNITLDLAVWDYSDKPLNFMGQICPFYSMLWFLLCLTLIFIAERFLTFFQAKKRTVSSVSRPDHT